MSEFNFNYNAQLPGSTQGQLSSGYSNWVQGEVSANADFIAFTLFQNGTLSLDAAKDLRTALQDGNFSISDLFQAAQSKIGEVDPAGSAKPVLNVEGFGPIDLTEFMGGQDLVSWTSGSGKNVVTHTREFLDTFTDKTADEGWDVPHINEAPVASPFSVEAVETESQYNTDHQITNLGSDIKYVDLLAGATDPEGGPLHIVDGSIDESSLPSWMSLDGHTLVIDQNSRDLDSLTDGAELAPIVIDYKLADAQGAEIGTSVTVDMTGTKDQYEAHAEGTVSDTFFRSEGKTLADQSLTFTVPSGAAIVEDSFDLSGTLTATGHNLQGPQQSDTTTIVDFNANDGSFNFVLTGNTSAGADVIGSMDLNNAALSDHEVDFNVTWNANAEQTDSVTVGLEWQADYWFNA